MLNKKLFALCFLIVICMSSNLWAYSIKENATPNIDFQIFRVANDVTNSLAIDEINKGEAKCLTKQLSVLKDSLNLLINENKFPAQSFNHIHFNVIYNNIFFTKSPIIKFADYEKFRLINIMAINERGYFCEVVKLNEITKILIDSAKENDVNDQPNVLNQIENINFFRFDTDFNF